MTTETEQANTRRAADWIANILPPLVLALATFATFAPLFSAQFVTWDDDQNFLFNRSYRGFGFENLRWMFTTFHMGPYQPLSWLTLALDWKLWELDGRGYHATNVLIHALGAVALYFVARRMFRAWTSASERDVVLASAVAAAAFALHPLRAESVGWVTERRDVLSGLFFVLALGAWTQFVTSGRRRDYVLTIVCVLLSFMGKALGLALPVVFLVLDVWPARRTHLGWRKLALEKLPFVALSAVFGWLALHGQSLQGGTLLSLEQHGPAQRVAQASYGLVFYTWRTLVPRDLIPFYEMPHPLDPWTARFVVPVLAVCAITGVCIALRRRAPLLLVGWLAFALLLAPVSGLTQAGRQLVADRYTYIPCLPFALLFGALALVSLQALPRWRLMIAALCGVLVCTSALLTNRQAQYWHDSESLWRRNVAIDPDGANGLLNLGNALMRDGALEADIARRDALYTEAEQCFERGLEVGPMPDMHVNLGLIALFRAQTHPELGPATWPRALEHIRRGITLAESTGAVKPDWRLAEGSALMSAGRCAEAVPIFESILPYLSETEAELRSLSLAYACVGRNEEAVAILERALTLQPNDATLWMRAGVLNAKLGRNEEARTSYENVIAIKLAALGEAAERDADVGQARIALGALR